MFFISFILVIIVFATILISYIKLTTGICKCSKHLVGKVVIVTGGNAGIGYETAKDLADRGARVIIACRNENRGTTACANIIASTGNNDVHYKNLDLASLNSVRNFANDIIKTEKRLDILINNAAILDVQQSEKTEDGLSLIMQTNHFAPFLLTNLLLPLLEKSAPSRIINVTSMAHRNAKIDFDNLNFEKKSSTYSKLGAYGVSKLCNILMTVELARIMEGKKVTANSLHPGVIATDMLTNLMKGVKKHFVPLIRFLSKSPWEGAQTTIYLAVSPEVEGISGRFYTDCRETKTSKLAQDRHLARRLWDVSEEIVGLKSKIQE